MCEYCVVGGNMEEQNFGVIIGSNIKQCLEEYQMDIKAYAIFLGVTRPTAYSYIEGTSIIDSYKLYRTAKRFKKSLGWFLEVEHKEEVFTDAQMEWIRKEIKSYLKDV
jgi:transcriptional regulator with XRE-family HTH domain